MQSWGWRLPPVATREFLEATKVRQVSPVSRAISADGSDDVKPTLKERRLALEQEITKLRKKHTQEVNLRRALERALQRRIGSLPRIPPYLPAKVQKLLAEVALLEEEVIRLEDHVFFLSQEISEETSESFADGTPKHTIVSASNSTKSAHICKIRETKESGQATGTECARELLPRKFHSGLHKAPSKPRDAAASNRSQFLMSTPAPIPMETLGLDASGLPAVPKGVAVRGPALVRKPPATREVLYRFQSLQQQCKPEGGANGKSNLFRQFNSLNWGPMKLATTKQESLISSSRSSPRTGFVSTTNLSLKRSDTLKSTSNSKQIVRTTPQSGAKMGREINGMPSVSLWEKENLQSVAAKLMSRSSNASKLGHSLDLSSSNVERKSMLGGKGSTGLPPSARRLSSLSLLKEGGGQANHLAQELVRCLGAIYSKLTKFSRFSASRGSYNSTSSLKYADFRQRHSYEPIHDVYGMHKDGQLPSIGSYEHAQEITVETIDSSTAGSSSALHKKLGQLMLQLEKVSLDHLSHHEKLAFWINVYNVCMMHAFLEHGIPSTPSKVVALMRKAVVNVGGYVLNALTIEHVILRLPCRPKAVRTSPWHYQPLDNPALALLMNVGMEEIIEHSAYGLDWNEPMVTFALCCGSRSSPALRVYTPSGIESELQIAKQEYLEAALGVSNQNKLHLPKLLEWYMHDFAKDMEGLLDWLCQQLSGPLRTAVDNCINHPRGGVLLHSIEIMPYDFNFRYLLLV